MRKSLSGKTPGLSDDKGMDRKKIKNIIIGTVVGTIVLLVIVVAVLTLVNKAPAATPTPVPTITPVPTVTPTPVPTVTPTPAPQSGRVYNMDGQFKLSALLKGDSGQLIVGITVAPGYAPVNVSNLSISIVCDGRTFDNVWTIKPKDWDNYDGDTTLRSDDNVAPIINTTALGVPQGRPLTVKVIRNGDVYQQISVAPT